MRKSFLGIVLFFVATCVSYAQLVAFPGAEGFGKYAKGARASSTPTVYHVTNLNDTGTGSFRDAVSASNRIVVFDVAGVIKITSRVVVSSNIYIAGQTAPGEGITIYGNGFSFSGASNTICRYLRIRMGAVGDSGKDACGIANGSNMIFDHVSVAWGRDETFSISGENPSNITIQNSIISQGLLSHSAGGLIQTNGGVTLYRNMYVNNDTRNNKIKGVNQYVNNIVYNWSSGAYIMGGDSEGDSYANCVSNYFINGPENSGAALGGGNTNFHIYALDNWWDKNRNGVVDGYLVPQSEYSGGPDFQSVPYNYPVVPTWSASQLVDSVIPGVGASLPYSDLLDCYMKYQVRSFGKKGAIIANETENPMGIPTAWTVWTGTKRTDTDNDGMPDEWENANGLNASLASDAVAYAANGYLNIENYINSIGKSYSQEFLRAPLNLVADSTTQNTVYLAWFDFTDKEQGYCVERKVNGTFTEIARTGVDGFTYALSGLSPEEVCVLRVRAYNANGYSAYSNELTVKSKPIPVPVLDLTTYQPDLRWTGAANAQWEKTSLNWLNGSAAAVFADSAMVYFGNSDVKNINIAENVGVKAMVVDADTSFVFSGAGVISGKGSVNKTGSGKLSLLGNNTYTGATVIYNGTVVANSLANGGVASSIGASQNYDFNLLFRGGKLDYTGGSVTTDRNMKLEGNGELGVSNAASVVTLTGVINGTGGLSKSGAGTILLKGINTYEGLTSVNEGKLEINGVTAIENAFASGKKIKLNGGYLKTSGGSTADYEDYYADIEVAAGKTSSFEPYRNCYIKSKVSGSGTLNFVLTYVREYLQGDWSQFSGTVNANAAGVTTDGNQFLLNNTEGIPNARVVLTSGTKVVCWKNGSTMYLGGLSGPSGSYLSGSDKTNNSATMTWVVGGAGTDEIFSGVINNECSNRSYKGVTSIVKDGEGYWKLSGANIYSGTTTVKGGMLIVNGVHTGTGKVTVMNEATLAGKGTMPSLVEVQAGATIIPGDPATAASVNTGTLTVGSLNMLAGSIAEMEINKTISATDKVAATGAVVLNGKLNLKITGTPQAGDQFTLFTGSSVSGSFSEIVPTTPGNGLAWQMTGGVLKVAAVIDGVNSVKESKIKLSQNPVERVVELTFPENALGANIQVLDNNGRICSNGLKVNQQKLSFDMSSYVSGIYYMKVLAQDGELYAVKLLKR